MAVVGDEEAIAVADRPEVRLTLTEVDPEKAIALSVAYSTELLERAGDLIMVSIEAAGADPEMRATADEGARATHRVHLALSQALHRRGALRDDLDPTSAADTCPPCVPRTRTNNCASTEAGGSRSTAPGSNTT